MPGQVSQMSKGKSRFLTCDLVFEFIPNPALLENCPFFLYAVSTKGRERDPYGLSSCLALPESVLPFASSHKLFNPAARWRSSAASLWQLKLETTPTAKRHLEGSPRSGDSEGPCGRSAILPLHSPEAKSLLFPVPYSLFPIPCFPVLLPQPLKQRSHHDRQADCRVHK